MGAEKERDEEIEIMPEMIVAGVAAYFNNPNDIEPYKEIVSRIYEAMKLASCKKGGRA